MLKEKLIRDYDLSENLGYEEDMLEELKDYSGYICDVIMEISDRYVSIYDYELWEIAPTLRYYIEESIEEFGTSENIDLIRIFQQGQYYYNSGLFYENLDNIIWNVAVIKLDELIENCNIDLPAYDILIPEMESYLYNYLDNIDNNNHVEDIEGVVVDMYNDYLEDNNYMEFEAMFDADSILIISKDNGGLSTLKFEYFKDGFIEYCKDYDITLPDIKDLKDYLISCNYNVVEIKEVE